MHVRRRTLFVLFALLLAALVAWGAGGVLHVQSLLIQHQLDQARWAVLPLAEQAAAALTQHPPSRLDVLVQTAVRGDTIYAQVGAGGVLLAQAASDMGLKVLPEPTRPPSQLRLVTRRHPAGARYLDVIYPLPQGADVAEGAYVRLGLSLAGSSSVLSNTIWVEAAGGLTILLLVVVAWIWTLRAPAPLVEAAGQTPCLEAGPLHIDDRRKEVRVEGQPVQLSQREYQLLKLLASEPGRVFSHREIVDAVWPDSPVSAEDVKKYIYLLRQKVEPQAPHPQLIVNVKGFGYRLET